MKKSARIVCCKMYTIIVTCSRSTNESIILIYTQREEKRDGREGDSGRERRETQMHLKMITQEQDIKTYPFTFGAHALFYEKFCQK